MDDQRVSSEIVQVVQNGWRWHDAPAGYGPPKPLYNRFVRWARRGVWEQMFMELSPAGDPPATVPLDATHIEALRTAGGRGGQLSRRSGGRGAAGPLNSVLRLTSPVGPSVSLCGLAIVVPPPALLNL